VLALGVFLVALVRLVEQNVPLPIVVIVAEVNDAFLLLVAQVIRPVVEDGRLPRAEQRWALPVRLGGSVS
jgi:hypothetical protein